MISPSDYFGIFEEHPDLTQERKDNAYILLERVNNLLVLAEANGVFLDVNPHTKTLVSGEVYGGFRPQDCPIGAEHSRHKEGKAVDVYDPHGDLDRWITESRLITAELAREHPSCTGTWCHLQSEIPISGHHTFYP